MTVQVGYVRLRLWLGRKCESNRALAFMGHDGLNQRSRGYWSRTYWVGPVFFTYAHDEGRLIFTNKHGIC